MVFNTKVSKEEYDQIFKPFHRLYFDFNEKHEFLYKDQHQAFMDMRRKLSRHQQKEFLNIPYFDREIFTAITSIEKLSVLNKTLDIFDI